MIDLNSTEWNEGFVAGQKVAWRRLLRYVVAVLGKDAEDELSALLGEQQEQRMDFILDTEEANRE